MLHTTSHCNKDTPPCGYLTLLLKTAIPPAGTQGGQKFKLSGKGFPSTKTGRRGDQYVNIRIAVPKNIPEKAKAEINEIEALYKESPRKGMLKNR